MDDLKECPFCGGKDIRFMGYSGMYQNSHCECKDCHTIGPAVFVDDGKAATEAWNRRAVPQANAEQDAQDKIDAARYRHMRNLNVEQAGAAGQPSIALPSGLNHGYYLTEETADYAIDESIKERAASKTTPSSGEGSNADQA